MRAMTGSAISGFWSPYIALLMGYDCLPVLRDGPFAPPLIAPANNAPANALSLALLATTACTYENEVPPLADSSSFRFSSRISLIIVPFRLSEATR